MNFHDLDNYNLADAVKFHQRLNPRLWGADEHLLPEVRDKLLAIASDFQEFLGVDDLTTQDITISGSNAAYSYTPHSDIDLHLVVDMPDDPVYQELFAAKKFQYNAEHDIKIAGVPVELYVQPSDQKHVSQGIYSVKNGDWTQVPQRRRATVDDSCVQHKTADLDARIHSAIKSGDADAVNQLWDKIKNMRQTGLEKNGEFGCENITFKLLRNMGCIGQLKDAKTAIQDRELSLARKPAPRKKMNYGMRDYWYPGTAYAGQDHPAGTESEQIDEAWQQGVLGLGSSGPEVAELQEKLGIDPDGKFGPATRQAVIALQKKLDVTPDGAYGPITRAAHEKSQDDKIAPSKETLKDPKDKPAATSIATATPVQSATPAANKPRVVVVGDSIAVGIAQAAGLPSDAAVGRSTKSILSAAASNPAVQGADVAIVSSGTNDYPLANGGRNNNPEATINNISRTRDALKAKQYVWILPFNRNAAEDVKKAIGNDAYVDLAEVSTTKDRLHPTSYSTVANAALSKFAKPGIMESVDPDHLKKILHRFYASCVDKLQLKNPPRLQLETTTDWSQENGSFGQYDSDSNTLILATSGRHVLDILRTMAHEMTHRQQDEQNPLPIDAGETGSPWEDQANAMAGRIMRDWAEEQPEMFDGVTLEEASGYIPTKSQARDPRFVMALTRDVRPGAVGKEANKLGLQTDSQGHPALLTAGLQKLLREFKEQDLFEINMGGKSLRKEAAKTGALAGMEFEMIVPDISSDGQELEPDFDSDETASSASDIINFFYDGDYNSRRSTQDMIDRMMDDYSNWQVEQFDTRWDGDAEEFIYQYIKDNIDDDDVRQMLDLEEEDPIGRQEYLLVADMIATEQMEPWYDDAKNDASDSFYEDDRFEDFLQDNNMEHMSDIYHRYDGIIHWPHYTGGGGGSTSVEDVADSFSTAVGRPAQARSDYHAYGQERPGPGKNFYVVEPDGSLEPDDTNDSGLEFVSPPLPIDDIMSDLKKVKKWADQTGCYTNDSTGLHINISVPNYSQDQLDYVKLALLMGDEYVLNNFGRAGNTYAKSAMGKIRGKVTPENAKQILDKMKSGLDQLATKAIHSGYTDKYTSINTKDGHIEFRSPGGDWLDENFDKIENTLMRFTVAMSAALNPEAYRQEYLKKLYKMLSPKGENDPLAIFAKYSAGQLPKAALKSFVRQAQLERSTKAAKQAELDTMQKELAPASAEDNQGNWGIWLGAANQFSLMPIGTYPAGQSDTLRRFPSQEAAEQFLAQTRASNPRMRTDAEVREIQPATAPAAMQPGQYQWQITDDNDKVVYSFVSSTAQRDANDVARNWIQSQPPSMSARGPFNVVPDASAEPIPGSTLDLQRQRQRDAALAAASMAADAAPSARQLQQMAMSNVTNPPYYPPPTPIPGVQDIDIDIPMAQTQWEVYNRSSNQPIFVMQAANQAEAWRKGQEWVAAAMQADPTVDASNFSVRPSAQPVVESITVLEQRLRQELDSLGNQEPTGPESPPKMPAGTIKVDVSDMYDWYKLGQHISDLKSIDKSTLGKGPPNTVFAFGSEELENKYSHLLTNLGLKTHDLDEPGEEDVDESFDQPYKGKWEKSESGSYDMLARLPDGTNLSIMFNNEGDDEWQVEFYRNNSQEVTGEGDAQRVFATVLNAIQKFVKKHKPWRLRFSASKEIDPTIHYGPDDIVPNPESRAKLYNRLVHRYANALGYDTYNEDHGDQITYELTRLKQDVDESQEITKLSKLDSVLERCIDMIYRGQESNPKKYGRVAACLIDDKNNHTYAINLPGPNGTRRHAERVAIDTHLKRHGRIGSNAIMVTTLSPCVNHMAERDGESCTELLSDYGIEKCYAGWQDPTQQPATAYPFNLQVTDNADIFNTCQNIAASFLPQVIANNLDEAINPDCFDPAFNDTQIFDGLTYRATVEEEYGKPVLTIKVLDDNFQQVGLSKFKQSKKGVVSLITSFRPEYQGQGIARNIYAYVRMLGNTIVPSRNQLPPGKAMWAAWKKSGDAKHLMKDVAEEEEPIRIKLNNNDAARAFIQRVYARYPHTMQNNHVMVWGSGDDQQFAMFELIPSFSKRGAVEVKWIQAYPLRQGVGSRAMKELQAMAREDGISLTLFPWDKGQVSQSKLTKFYRGQGFKPTVKGGKAMQWEPK